MGGGRKERGLKGVIKVEVEFTAGGFRHLLTEGHDLTRQPA